MRSLAMISVALLALVSIPALAAPAPAASAGEVHEDGWWAGRVVAPADGALLLDFTVDNVGAGAEMRGAAAVLVVHPNGTEVGRFIIAGGETTLEASAGSDFVERVQLIEEGEDDGKRWITFYLLIFMLEPSAEYDVVLVAASDGPFYTSVHLIAGSSLVRSTSGVGARVLGEEDFFCGAAAVAGLPQGATEHPIARGVAMAGCRTEFAVADSFFGFLRAKTTYLVLPPAFGFESPSGGSVEATGDTAVVTAGEPGTWSVFVNAYAGAGLDEQSADVTGLVADVRLP